MPALDVANRALMRTRPISRDWWLYIYQPLELWRGTVGGTPAQGDRALTVATVGGDVTDLVAGMTIRVTDAAGNLKEPPPSRVRFKSYSAPTMTIAENAIDWVAGDILYGMRLFELWPRIPYINPATGEQFKDRDIAWTSDADAQLPKANSGPAVIALLVGATVDTVFKDEGSFDCPGGNAVVSHQYAALPAVGSGDPGAPTVSAGAENTPTVTYRWDTAGYYYVSHTVTDGNAKTGVVYTPVVIDGGTLSVNRVVPGSRSWDGSGWSLARDVITLDGVDTTWYDGAPAFLTADTYAVPTQAYVDNRSNLRWSGWLTEDSTDRDAYSRGVSFRAVSTAHIMKNIPAYPVRMVTDAAPSDWYEFTSLSIDSIAYLLGLWHSTLMWVADYHPTLEDEWVGGAGARARPGENCRSGDLLGQINAVLAAAQADLRCDRQGITRAMRNEWFLTAAEEAARVTVFTLQNGDFSRIRYGPHQHRAQVREVRSSGVDGSGNPYIAGAPGPSPLDGGRPAEEVKLSPKSQAELNQWAGQELAIANWHGQITLRMSGEYDVTDPALGEFIAGALATYDSRIPDGPYSVQSVSFEDDHRLGLTIGEWTLLPDPGKYPAQARALPLEPPAPPPPADYPDPEELPPVEPIGSGEVWVLGTKGGGVVYTLNMRSGNPPTWAQLNGGLADSSFIRWFTGDRKRPSSHLACIDDTSEVYVHTSWRDGGNWSLALSEAAASAIIAVEVGTINTLVISQVYAFARDVDTESYLYAVVTGTGADYGSYARVLWSQDWGTSWAVFDWRIVGRFHAFVSAPTCDYSTIEQILVLSKTTVAMDSSPQTGYGGLAFNPTTGQLILGARCRAGALSRSNLFRANYGDGGGWGKPYFNWTDPQCPMDTGAGGDAVGGKEGTPTQGPGGVCISGAGTLFMGNWRTHEDDPFSPDVASLMNADTMLVYPGAREIGIAPDMIVATPDPADDFIALEVSSGETNVYRNSGVAYQATINRICWFVQCYPILVDGRLILIVGRATGIQSEADALEPELVFYSEDGGNSFVEKGQTMFAGFSVLGITGAHSDPSSD